MILVCIFSMDCDSDILYFCESDEKAPDGVGDIRTSVHGCGSLYCVEPDSLFSRCWNISIGNGSQTN